MVPEGTRVSDLDRLRRAPRRASGPEMLRALNRAREVLGLGAGSLEIGEVPPARIEVLARQGLTTNAAMLRRLPQVRRTATLIATVRALGVAAVDDALDLFAVLMATKLIGTAERASVKERLRSLPQLRQASITLAAAARVLLEVTSADAVEVSDPASLGSRLQDAVPRERLAAAVATVDELAPDAEEDADAAMRVELVKRYATVRPFLAMLAEVVPLAATEVGRPVLTAVQGLAELASRRRMRHDQLSAFVGADVVGNVVTGSWRRLVFANPDLPERSVDLRAYTLCVLEALHRGLRRRDVYAVGSTRWGDPRARLLDGPAWEQTRPQVLTALRLTDTAQPHLDDLAGRLDAAYTGLAAKIGLAGQHRPVTGARQRSA